MTESPSENVELVERFADAFNRRDLDAFLALCHPEIEFHRPVGSTTRGQSAAREWATRQWQGNTPVEVEADSIEDAGDGRVIQHGRLLYRWRETGELAQTVAVRAEFTIADGTVIRWQGGPVDDFRP